MSEVKRQEMSHIWQRQDDDHYVEPIWCSKRLFEVEHFDGEVWDPCCGWGRIVDSAVTAGHPARGSDIVVRSDWHREPADFLACQGPAQNIVSNPPFARFREIAEHALGLSGVRKVALMWLTRTLPAARWLQHTPLARVWLLTPRPSMPPGHVIASGIKPGGGKQDFCWLVWDVRHRGPPSLGWLHRDGDSD